MAKAAKPLAIAELSTFNMPPLTTVFSRTLIGTLAVLAFMRVDGTKLIIPRDQLPKLVLLAVINCVLPFTLYAWGETRVSAGAASIINATTPMFTLLVAGLLFRNDKLTGGRIAGVLCGMAGVAVVVGPVEPDNIAASNNNKILF